jgi:alpha-galactosidase/6-phospho-beta-glucosidase family protein
MIRLITNLPADACVEVACVARAEWLPQFANGSM